MSTKLEFGFNTALLGIDNETGAWNKETEKKLADLAKVIRGILLRNTDGLTGLFVARYGMSVEYLPKIITTEAVVEAVQAAIHEVAQRDEKEGFFPLRGNKKPQAIVETHVPQPTSSWVVKAVLRTDLYAYPADHEGNDLRNQIATELLQLDGLRDYTIYLNGVELTVNADFTTVEETKEHIRTILQKHADNQDSTFIPFCKGPNLPIEWATKNIMK